MSIGDNLPVHAGSNTNESQGEVGSGVTKEESNAFLEELEKVFVSGKSLVGDENKGEDSEVTHVNRPSPTIESEKVKEKDSLKKRFLKAIIRRDFQSAYREISHKVASREFVQWLNRVIPDANLSFDSFRGLDKSSLELDAEDINLSEEGEKFLDKMDAGAKILGALNKLVIDDTVYSASSLIEKIDVLLSDLYQSDVKIEDLINLLKELKSEFSKKPINQDDVLKILEKYKEVVAIVYPAFTQLSSADTFKTQFKTLTSGFCEVIEDNLDSTGLFRVSGNIGPESVIVTRLLDGDPPEDVFEELNNVNDYCDGLMHLCDQLMDLKGRGVLSEDDIKEMQESIEKIHDLLINVERNPNNKMTSENLAIVAGKLTRVLDLLDLNNWKKEGETDLQIQERMMKALQAEKTSIPSAQSNKKNKHGALARIKQLFNISKKSKP